MLHLMLHALTVYNGHLQGPVTLTPVVERLAVDLSPTVLTILVFILRLEFQHQAFRMRGKHFNQLRHRI